MFAALTNTRKIAALTFLSSLYFYSHVGTLYLQERGLNLFQVNSISAIIIGTIFLAEVPTGVIADRIGRKWSVVLAMAFQLLGEVLYLFARDYWAFALLSVIAGIGFAFSSGAVEALIYDTLPAADDQGREQAMQQAMGAVGFAYQLAFFLAPLVGSFLIPVYSLPRFLFVVALTAASVGVALLVALTLEEPATPRHHTEQSPFQLLRAGFGQLRRQPRLQWLLLIGALTSTFGMVLVGLYQPYFHAAGISAFGMGWAFAVGALVAGVSTRYVYKVERWLGKRWGLWLVTILPGLAYLLLAWVTSPGWIFVAFILTYGTTTLKNPLLSAAQNGLIAPAQRATVLSLLSLGTSLYVAIMSLVIGWLADWDLRVAFALIGMIIVVATVLLRVDRIGVVPLRSLAERAAPAASAE